MAVAGINNVSVLESSYFGDNYSSLSRIWGNQEKPITRTSFIRKLWRDLEDGSKVRETERKQGTGMAGGNTGSQCSCSSEGSESEDLSINTSEVENECPLNQNQMGIQKVQEDNQNQNLCLQNSPAIGMADKERVRQVFREWGTKNNNGLALNVSHRNNCSRGRTICETESNRVRTVRQWLQSNTQEVKTGQSHIEEQDGLGVSQASVGAQRSIRLLYGRHALRELLKRFEMERKIEMQSLLERRPVSTFAHRKRIQALLKGRFLWNQRFVQDERSTTSTAASELGLLRQSQTVSDLRKGFLSRVSSLEQGHDGPQSDTSSDNGMNYQENQLPIDSVNESDIPSDNDVKYQKNQLLDDIVNEYEYEGQQEPPPNEIFESTDQNQHRDQVGSMEVKQGVHHIEPSQQSLELKSQYESDGDELEVDEASDRLIPSEIETDILSWQEENIEAEDNLADTESIHSSDANLIENPDEWLYQETVHDGWYNNHPAITRDAFYTTDDEHYDDYDADDNNTRLELQRLTSRRRVTNLLQSDFRVRLEQLIQSYLARQDQASESEEDWMLESGHQDPYQLQSENENENDENVWQQHLEITQCSGTEWEIINGLRTDMVMLQERMNNMQSTLETCMKMQSELQRSVQQEVSSALNRSSNPGEENLQACFLCCDSGFDSPPNTGGHVYVCSNCAEKINWSKVKESVRHP